MRRSRGIVPYLFRHAEAEPRFHMGQYRAHTADVQGNKDVAHGVQRPGGSGGGTPLHPSQGKRRGRIQTEGITDSEQPQGPRHVQPGAACVQPGQEEGRGAQRQQPRHHAHPQSQPALLHQGEHQRRAAAKSGHQNHEHIGNAHRFIVHDIAHELHRSHPHPANAENVAQGRQQAAQEPPVAQHADVQQRGAVGHAGNEDQGKGTKSAVHPPQHPGRRPAVRLPVNKHHQHAHASHPHRQEGKPVEFPSLGNLLVGNVKRRQHGQHGRRRTHHDEQTPPVPVLHQQAPHYRAGAGCQANGTKLHAHRHAATLRRQGGIHQPRSVNQRQAASCPLKEAGCNHEEEMVRRQSQQGSGQHDQQSRAQGPSQPDARPQIRRHGKGEGSSQRARRTRPGNIQGAHHKCA